VTLREQQQQAAAEAEPCAKGDRGAVHRVFLERLVGMPKASARLRLDTSVSVFDMALAVVRPCT